MPERIPILETARLRLRPHSADDFPSCQSLWADPAVTRYIGGKPLTAEESWAKLLRYAGHWTLLGFGFWVVEEKATGMFAGELGFAEFKRDVDPPLAVPEAGWAIAPAAQGRGYATEALRAALEWANRPTACLIHPENAASLGVAAKCGYRESRRTLYKGLPTVVLER